MYEKRDDAVLVSVIFFFIVSDKLMKCLYPDAIGTGSVDSRTSYKILTADSLRQRGKSKSYTFYARHIFFDDTRSILLNQSYFYLRVFIYRATRA